MHQCCCGHSSCHGRCSVASWSSCHLSAALLYWAGHANLILGTVECSACGQPPMGSCPRTQGIPAEIQVRKHKREPEAQILSGGDSYPALALRANHIRMEPRACLEGHLRKMHRTRVQCEVSQGSTQKVQSSVLVYTEKRLEGVLGEALGCLLLQCHLKMTLLATGVGDLRC